MSSQTKTERELAKIDKEIEDLAAEKASLVAQREAQMREGEAASRLRRKTEKRDSLLEEVKALRAQTSQADEKPAKSETQVPEGTTEPVVNSAD